MIRSKIVFNFEKDLEPIRVDIIAEKAKIIGNNKLIFFAIFLVKNKYRKTIVASKTSTG